MMHPAHKKAFLQALDGVDHEIDKLTLGSKQHTASARAAAASEASEGQEPEGEKPDGDAPAGVDPSTGEKNTGHVKYRHESPYEGKDNPGGHADHPFGRRGVGGVSQKPLFGKRFTR